MKRATATSSGRVKDLIIRGGENISPREIEEFLFRHAKIQDVQVFGVPDRRFGEVVCAWIRLKAGQQCTAEEVRDFCRDQIAHYKVPAHMRFVEQFPMTVTGKIQKFVMREADDRGACARGRENGVTGRQRCS